MFAVLFAYAVGILLIADSLHTAPWWLSAANVVAGVWFVIAGSIAGWRLSRGDDE